MEDIYLKINNSQWKEAIRLVKNSRLDLGQVMQYIIEDEFMEDEDAFRLWRMAKAYGYVQEHYDYEDNY